MAKLTIRRPKITPKRPRRTGRSVDQHGAAIVKTGFARSVPMTVFSGITDHKITLNITLDTAGSGAPFIGTSGNREVNPILWLFGKYQPFKDRVYTTALINPRSIAVATVQKYMGINLYEADMQKLRIYHDLQFSITSVTLYLPAYEQANEIQLNRATLSYDAGKQTLGRTGNVLVQNTKSIPYVKIMSGSIATWNHISEVNTHDFIIVNHAFDEFIPGLAPPDSKRRRAKLGHLVFSLRFNMSPYEIKQNKDDLKNFHVKDQGDDYDNTSIPSVAKLSLGTK